MATFAAEKALANSGLTAADIDLVVVATCSSIDRCPNVATRVAAKLGIAAPGAYDLNTACSGFSYALGTADHAIRAGAARNAHRHRRREALRLHRLDRPLHRRASSATAPAPRWSPRVADGEEPGIGPVLWGSAPEQGRRAADRGLAARTSSRRARRCSAGPPPRWPRSRCRPASGPASRPSELAAFVPHQANTRIIDGIVKRLGIARTRSIAKDIVESGNTSAASVPLALSKLVERREVPSGAPVLLFGFGGGLTYAGQVVRCP